MFLMVVGAVLYFVGSPEGPTGIIVKGIVVAMWYLVLSIIADICLGYVGLPIITILFGASLLAWLIQSRAHCETEPMERMVESFHGRRPSLFQRLNADILEASLGIIQDVSSDEEEEDKGENIEVQKENSEVVDIDSIPYVSGVDDAAGIERKSSEENLRKRHTVHFTKARTVDDPSTPADRVAPIHSSYSVDSPSSELQIHSILKSDHEFSPSPEEGVTVTHIFLILITTCLLVLLWRNMWLLMIVVPLVIWTGIKKYLLRKFPVVSSSFQKCKQSFTNMFAKRKSILFPQPIPIVIQLCKRIDSSLLGVFKSSVSPIISGAIIMAMIVGGIGAFVFFILQVQVELVYAVTMMKQVLNTSVAQSPWIQR